MYFEDSKINDHVSPHSDPRPFLMFADTREEFPSNTDELLEWETSFIKDLDTTNYPPNFLDLHFDTQPFDLASEEDQSESKDVVAYIIMWFVSTLNANEVIRSCPTFHDVLVNYGTQIVEALNENV